MTCSLLIEKEIQRLLRAEFDFTLPRFELLAQLDKAAGGLTCSTLSKRMLVSQGNLTAIVCRLVGSGHIIRTRLSADKRTSLITLTPFGRKEFRRMADRHQDWIGSLFFSVSVDRRADLAKRLAELERSMRQARLTAF